jgi:hypothetical protein
MLHCGMTSCRRLPTVMLLNPALLRLSAVVQVLSNQGASALSNNDTWHTKRPVYGCFSVGMDFAELIDQQRVASRDSSIEGNHSWRRRHAEVPTHRSGQVHRLFTVRNGLLIRAHGHDQPVEIPYQGFQFRA